MPEDAELVRRSLSGDHQAFARLVQLHRPAAARLAVAMIGSGADADDVVQDAFIKAFTRLVQFDTNRRFRGWLLAIVANEARNRRRATGRRTAVTLRVAVRAEEPGKDPTVDPAHALERGELRERLAEAITALSDQDRELIALRYFAELTEAETATALGCPVGTVKSRLSRALLRLRTRLTEEVTL
jgi:RNA polymerase sigma-70 factor, ECF subfamily